MTIKQVAGNIAAILRKPHPYRPVLTEAKGIFCLLAGTVTFVASQAFKLSSDPKVNQLSKLHVIFATKTFKQGLKDFLPGSILIASTALTYRNWEVLRNTDLH